MAEPDGRREPGSPSEPPDQREPTDPDVDLRLPAQRGELTGGRRSLLAAVAVGGAIGAAARYGAAQLWPAPPDGFPWATFGVNVLGCAVIGVFMTLVSEAWRAHRLVRPFFGTGVLGGFTTFSTYAVDVERLVDGGHPATGLAYLGLTLMCALAAVAAGVRATRGVLGRRGRC